MSELRAIARELFLGTLQRCTVEAAFSRQVEYAEGTLRIAGQEYRLDDFAQVLTIAMGKAAHTMATALCKRIGARAQGTIAAPHDVEELGGFRVFAGGHPWPNAASLAAGAAILDDLRRLDQHSLAIFLLSGGGSAVVEAPISAEFSLEDVVETYRVLVHCGASIREINAIRKHLSATKGGRMAQAAHPARQLSLMVSDVPADALDALASGPTLPDSTTCAECYAIAERHRITARLPRRVRRYFSERTLRETPKEGDAAFARSQWTTILSSEEAQAIAAELASAVGFAVTIDNTCDDWDYLAARDHLLGRLRELRARSQRVCLISGGEVTVRVPEDAGRGGRNQQFALSCAEAIGGEDIAVLSCGTDGIDGNSPAAGALVDGTTWRRAGAEALRSALRRCDAYPLLAQLGDAIETGATGNNVRDLRMLFAR